jgi:hypothetical protein
MERDSFALVLAIVGTLCWAVCFVWMHKISTKQNNLLDKLTEQNKRIEKLSKAEHELIQEVHPQVGEIRDDMQEMKENMREQDVRRRSGK